MMRSTKKEVKEKEEEEEEEVEQEEETAVWPSENAAAQVIVHYKVCITNNACTCTVSE